MRYVMSIYYLCFRRVLCFEHSPQLTTIDLSQVKTSSFLASTLHRARSPLYPSSSSVIDIVFTSPTTHISGLLECPENQHVFAGTSPASTSWLEQLAFHVLSSIHHQSWFASFSRQLYVSLSCCLPLPSVLTSVCPDLWLQSKASLRSVDPTIDDPNASTWCQYSLFILDVSPSS